MTGEGKGIPRPIVLIAALLGCMILPAAASATTRYAAPGGTAADTVCVTPEAAKCSIGAAAGGPDVLAADEAVILPGEYSDTAGDLNGDTGNPTDGVVQPTAGSVHGASGQPIPVITLNTNTFYGAFLLGGPVTLSDVEIVTSVSTSDVTTFGGTSSSVVDGVIARSSTDNALVCDIAGGTIRNSACLSSGSGGTALGASTFIGGTFTTNVRNVTAISTGTGSYGAFYFYGTASPPVGPTITVSAKSLISQGTAQDVRVRSTGTGSTVTMNLDHSDYDTAIDEDVSGGVASVTAPGTGTGNITAGPMLAADGYHELTGSPTVNAGATDGLSGTQDVEGQQRTIDMVADIGADELGHPTTTQVSCNPNPILVGTATTCSATVIDTTMSGGGVPQGTVEFSSDTTGGVFDPAPSCTLTVVGEDGSDCDVAYTPGTSGPQQISASFPGDTVREASNGSTDLAVTAPPTTTGDPPPTGGGPSSTPGVKKKCKKKKKKHSAGAAKKKKCKKKKRR